MKRVFQPGFLFVVALFSVVVSVPFLRIKPDYAFEVTLSTPRTGFVQIFYAFKGEGFNEDRSSLLPLAVSPEPHKYHMEIPAGEVTGLRFDPVNNDGAVTISDARIVSADGAEVRRFKAQDFAAANQISHMETPSDGSLVVQPTPGGNDPYLMLRLDQPLNLPVLTGPGKLLELLLVPALWIFAVILTLSLAAEVLVERMGASGCWAALTRWCEQRPRTVLMITATLAVVLSSYPVVLLGKSFVTPNTTLLLYDQYPTLPGYSNTQMQPTLGSDVGAMMWWYVPTTTVEHQALFEDHELPLWNRYNSGGIYLLGQLQSMAGDPLHWPVIIFNGSAWAWDMKFLVSRWLFAFGSGLVALRLAKHLPSAMLTTLSALFIGFFIFRFDHPAIFSLCYGPWVLYCWLLAAESWTMRETAIFAGWLILANWFEFNSGTAKEAVMLLVGLNFTGVIMLAFAERPWRAKLRKYGVLAGAGVIFVLLSAPMWMTFLEQLPRAFTEYSTPSVKQTSPGEIIGLFDEAFFRHTNEVVWLPSANFLVLIGICYFLATLGREKHSRMALAMGAGMIIPFALAFGLIPTSVIIRIPFLKNVYHIGNTFSCVLIVQMIPLAAVGYQAAWRRLGTVKGRSDMAIVLLLIGALIAGYYPFWRAFWLPGHGTPTGFAAANPVLHWIWNRSIKSYIWASITVLPLTAVTLLVVSRVMLRRRQMTPATGLLALLCVVIMLWRFGLQVQAVGFDKLVHRPGVRADLLASSTAVNFVKTDMKEPHRVEGIGNNLWSGWSDVYGLEGINGPDALMDTQYVQLKDALGLTQDGGWRVVVSPNTLAALKPAYDFFNVGYYLDDADENQRFKAMLQPALAADLQVYRSDNSWPRAFFTDRMARYHDAKEFAGMVLQGDGRAFAAMQDSDTPPPLKLPDNLNGRTVTAAHNYLLRANDTSFDVTATGPGVIVLGETWFKDDFRVLIDGKLVDYFRIDHMYKGVAVDSAGRHHVSFEYWPRYFTLSLCLCVLGAMLLAGSAFIVHKFPTALEAAHG